MEIQIKRIYEKPHRNDGTRVLVDRLWPRGVRKEDAAIDVWFKELAPSTELRTQFHQTADFKTFAAEYKKELAMNYLAAANAMPALKRNRLTLVTAVKDVEHSHVPILKKFLEKKFK